MTDADLDEIIARTAAANAAWVRGDWAGGYGAFIAEGADVTIYGPFGGSATVGSEAWASRGPAAAAQFRNGVSALKVISAHRSGDLAVLVALEEQRADIAGHADHPWTLRTTLVFRRGSDGWRVVHRHADPLSRFRSMEETLAIARG